MKIYISSLAIICIYMIVCFLLAQIKKDNSIVDIAWGIGFVVVAWSIYLSYDTPPAYLLLLIVTNLWGIRLAGYLFIRNSKTKGEDWRYQNMRKNWGNKPALHAFFKVFMLQGCLMWLIAMPLMAIENNSIINSWMGLQYIGLTIAIAGWIWESIADGQLYFFKKDSANKGKIMRSGLWAYSRHPNYFGEIIFWWGLYVASIPHGHWWISIIGPVTITFFLMRVSGVPMLENKYKDNPEYQAYIKATNALIPRFL